MITCDLFRVGTVGLMAISSLPFAALCVLLFCTRADRGAVLIGASRAHAGRAARRHVRARLRHRQYHLPGQPDSRLRGGAAVVAVLDPHKTLGIDAVTFGLSALILLTGVRSRPAPGRADAARASLWSVSADGVRIVFGSRLLLTLLLFDWLLGILAGGAMAQLVGAPLAVGLAGLVGLTAATMLAMSWTHLRGRLIQARPNGPESPGPGG